MRITRTVRTALSILIISYNLRKVKGKFYLKFGEVYDYNRCETEGIKKEQQAKKFVI